MTKIAILEDRLSYASDLSFIIKMEVEDAEVEIFSDVDSAFLALEKSEPWDIWLVDLMMPVGASISLLDANSGLATGTVFIERIIATGKLPKKIFVISSRSAASDGFEAYPNLITVLQKSEHTQIDIARLVKAILMEDCQ